MITAAISDAEWAALAGIFVGLSAAIATIVVAIINREKNEQDVETTESVSDFEKAYRERGDLIDGYRSDHASLVGMIATLREDHDRELRNLREDHDRELNTLRTRVEQAEAREQGCLDALEFAEHRIAVLEAATQGG